MQGGSIVLAAQDGALLRSDDDGVGFRVVRQGDAVPTADVLALSGSVLLAGVGGARLAAPAAGEGGK